MSRLYRPHIPISVRVTVATRQIMMRGFTPPAKWPKETPTSHLLRLLRSLARTFCCEVEDLRLDHDPPLGARPKRGEGSGTIYDPPANDPIHLDYRPHGAQFAGSHDVKTRIRGDHGQYSDIALIKRERRRLKKEAEKKKLKSAVRKKYRWPKRAFPQRRDR